MRYSLLVGLGLIPLYISTSWANSLQQKAAQDVQQQYLTGLWHCQSASPQLRYNGFIQYHKNQSYTENSTLQIKFNGQWISVPYQAHAKWSFNNSNPQNIVLSNYQQSAFSLEHLQLDEQEQSALHHELSQIGAKRSQVVRLAQNILVLNYRDHWSHHTSLRCSRKKA